MVNRIIEYAVFFVTLVLLQLFLFNNLNLSVYVNPLVYVAFIVLLPMETPPVAMLLLGLLLGVNMDLVMGTAGINTIATLFTAYTRPVALRMVLAKDDIRDGGIPSPVRMGRGKFIRYAGIVVFLQCFVFFTFESLTWSYYYLTLLRIVLSTIVTTILVWFSQMLFLGNYGRGYKSNDR